MLIFYSINGARTLVQNMVTPVLSKLYTQNYKVSSMHDYSGFERDMGNAA